MAKKYVQEATGIITTTDLGGCRPCIEYWVNDNKCNDISGVPEDWLIEIGEGKRVKIKIEMEEIE